MSCFAIAAYADDYNTREAQRCTHQAEYCQKKAEGYRREAGDNIILDKSKVNAPVFDVFPMTMECCILQKSGEQEGGYILVGEILNIQVDEKYLGANGKPDVEKMKIITIDPVNNTYIVLGHTVGHAFRNGLQLK